MKIKRRKKNEDLIWHSYAGIALPKGAKMRLEYSLDNKNWVADKWFKAKNTLQYIDIDLDMIAAKHMRINIDLL